MMERWEGTHKESGLGLGSLVLRLGRWNLIRRVPRAEALPCTAASSPSSFHRSPGPCIPPDIAPSVILVIPVVNAGGTEMFKLQLFMQMRSKKTCLTIKCSVAFVFYTYTGC